ncbi:hypothetical protein Btru_019317 [Bulinus truncatus]|nr:hypothetical protein Btru_019317 [Bulinus truncatus]
MASLVADYSDSESEKETEVNKHEEIIVKQEPCDEADCKLKQEPCDEVNIKMELEPFDAAKQNYINFFEASESDSDEESKAVNTPVKVESGGKLPNLLVTEKLPSIIEAAKMRIGTSVFMNPFEEAEQAKNQMLEKHVKLTQAVPRKPGHQPICWKFKKGKCHMGKNCRFFHDPESRILQESKLSQPETQSSDSIHHPVYHSSAYSDASHREMNKEEDNDDDDSYLATMKKKKRYGVCDNLVPPKKAFESLQRQREKERPWTLSDSHLQLKLISKYILDYIETHMCRNSNQIQVIDTLSSRYISTNKFK